MPLKQTKTFINEQARAAASLELETNGLSNFKQVGTSYYIIADTIEGERLVEVGLKVRDFKIKPGKEAEAIEFKGENRAQDMLDYIVEDARKRQAKAEEKAEVKEEKKRKDLAKKAELAAAVAAMEKEKKDAGTVGGEMVQEMIEKIMVEYDERGSTETL